MILKGLFHEGTSLCRLCWSSIFGVRADFGMDASHIFPQIVLAVNPLIRGCDWCQGVQSQHWMLRGASSLLCGFHSPIGAGVFSPVAGVEFLRVGFDRALLPLKVCSVPRELSFETVEAHVITENLSTTHTGIHGSAQKQPKVAPLPPLSSFHTQCLAAAGGQGAVAAGIEVFVQLPGTRTASVASLSQGLSAPDLVASCGIG